MKKFLKTIAIILVIILICLVIKLDILEFSAYKVDEQSLLNYTGYYFKQLQQEEKEIYVKIDDAAKNIKKKVILGSMDSEGLSDKVGKVLTAYFYDNPEIFYITNQYTITTRNLKLFNFSILELNYIVNSNEEIELKKEQLNKAINKIVSEVVTDNMTEFEKELSIHDAIVKQVDYYNYKNIEDIPYVKHTAYGALVQNEAVCDGYSKAFKLLLEKAGIDSIIINGETEGIAHAWNIVDIQSEYYHVDVTSNKLEDKNKYAIHAYFNLSDSQISETHSISNRFNIPKCNYETYEYYNNNGYYISEKDNLYDKLGKVIIQQKKSGILEVKVNKKYTARRLIDTLYDLNFNNWQSNGKRTVEYTKIQDKYIFIK